VKALVNRGEAGMAVDMVDVPEPEPAATEAVVEPKAVSVNRGELRLLKARDRGWRPGQDVGGIVVERAADGSGPEPGARVVAWPEQGGWAERVAVPTSHVAPIAGSVSFSQAATLPIAGITALRALRVGDPLAGKQVLITGASGGVGRFAVELAAGAGATVTGVARDQSRAAGLQELGATDVVFDLDGLEGRFDLILESSGGRSFEAGIRLVAPGGRVVVFGNSSDTPATISFSDFRGHAGAQIIAFFVYESGEPPTFGEDLRLLADLIADDKLHPSIGLETPWTEANEVFEAVWGRQVNGKAVLLVE
jgi:NADPH:quinone reductase-like Zn-dependent oxidoreductase